MTDLNDILQQAFSEHQAGRLDLAETGYRTVLQQAPATWSAMTLLATIALQRGQWSEAVAGFRQSLELNAAQPDALLNLGNALRELGRAEQALACYEQSLAIQPDFVAAWVNRGNVQRELRQFTAAINSYQQALARQPDSGDIYNNLGIACWEAGLFDAALQTYDAALQRTPDDASIWHNRGHVLRAKGLYQDALATDQRALQLRPGYIEAMLGCGDSLCEMRQYEAGLQYYEHAIAIKPDYADAWWAKALTQLQQGDFRNGWRNYEWRWQLKNRQAELTRYAALRRWIGDESLQGKNILLHAEQGFGDAIQFCRYATELLQMGAAVTLEVRPSLVKLMQTLSPKINVVAQTANAPLDFDFHCPLMSLPLALGTTLQTIPADIPYLHAEAAKQQQWQARLGAAKCPRIGLVWSGSRTHKGDAARSIPLTQLQPLFKPHLEFHALQTEIREDDQATLINGLRLVTHLEQLHDFSDTAALISQMDLIVTVDTSVAHLAGAMGKAVWVMLPFAADFRWLLEREDSPWYPSMRLFRQTSPCNWQTTILDVENAIEKHFSVNRD